MRCFKLPLVLFGSWFVPFLALAQYNPGFVATHAVPAGGTPWAAATADLNHDGLQDVVIADGSTATVDANGVSHTTINGISVLLGKGGGAFRAAVHYPTTESASFVAIADVDGDGHPDVITADNDPNQVSPGGSVQVLKNNGDGSFGASVKYNFPGWNATAVYPGDLDSDGHVDLVVALTSPNFDGHATQYLFNNGNGTFRVGPQFVGPLPVAVADFNRDGNLDVAALFYHRLTQNRFGVMFGNGAGTFSLAGLTDVAAIDTYFNVAVGDVNGDGYPDVAYIADDSSAVTVLLNSAGGNPFAAKTFTPTNDLMTGICLGDFNHDGHMDLAIIDPQTRLFVSFGRGDGTFGFPAQYDTSGTAVLGVGSLSAVDLNNDGILDLATTTPAGSFVPIFGKPGGTFNAESEISIPVDVVNYASITADFNNDGIPDIATLNFFGLGPLAGGPVQFFLGDGHGRFKQSSPMMADPGFFASGMAAGDVNHDGKLDLVFLNQTDAYNNPEFAVMLGTGNGTFGTPQYFGAIPPANTYVLPQETTPIYLADVNNDGKLDVVTFLGVHLGIGNGTFAAPIPLPDSNYIFALGDFNKDGNLDLVTLSDARAPVLSVYLGNGTSRFQVRTYTDMLPFGDQEHDLLAIGHFTKDGNLGVVVGSSRQFFPDFTVAQNGAFALFAGNGNGTLKAPVIYQVPYELWDLAIGDFNDDGADDVAAFNSAFFQNQVTNAASYNDDEVSLFTSKGDGTLLSPTNLGAGDVLFFENPGKLIVADFNRDGAVDIAGSSGSGEDILMNSRGTSLFFTATPPTTVHGHAVTLRCAVTTSFHFSGTLSGSVTFYEGANALATTNLATGDVATVDILGLPVGTHTVTAVFNGNGNYNGHRSSPVTFTVTP